MRFVSPRGSAERVGNSLSRTIVEKVDDTKLMQYHNLSLYSDEQQNGVEHAHQYGFVNVPQEPTGEGKQRTGAEAFMGFMGGGRSHGVAFMAGDRRYRLYKLANGEVAMHDDQGQQIHMKRDGLWASVPNSKKVMMQIMDDDKLPQADDAPTSGKQKMGQVQQAGRSAAINVVLDKSQFTINHPSGHVQVNCASFGVNASGDVGVKGGGNVELQAGNKLGFDASGPVVTKGGGSVGSNGAVSSPGDQPPIPAWEVP
jgi:phage gp45-like